jgi:hypothetical protein
VSTCSDRINCPALFEINDGESTGDVALQGYVMAPAEVPGLSAPPAGEAVVRMPRETFLRLAEALQARPVPIGAEDLFDGFQRSAFRLETLPQYLVDGEADRLRAFREGRPLPERSVATNPWLQHIAQTSAAGVRWHRVHVVDRPLTEYVRFELLAYVENAAAGEDIRIAVRADNPELAALHEDFWLLDGDDASVYALLMRYEPSGRPIGAWRAVDPATIERCRRQRDLAIAKSTPLAEFLAAETSAQASS